MEGAARGRATSNGSSLSVWDMLRSALPQQCLPGAVRDYVAVSGGDRLGSSFQRDRVSGRWQAVEGTPEGGGEVSQPVETPQPVKRVGKIGKQEWTCKDTSTAAGRLFGTARMRS